MPDEGTTVATAAITADGVVGVVDDFADVPAENKFMVIRTAAGEVRDADGNLLNVVEGSSEPQIVTESELKAILEGNQS